MLRKTAKHEKVIEPLKMLMNILEAASTNKEVILNALNSEFKDFEDAIQNFFAQNDNSIRILLTRNVKDYKSSELSIMTPENFLKIFK